MQRTLEAEANNRH